MASHSWRGFFFHPKVVEMSTFTQGPHNIEINYSTLAFYDQKALLASGVKPDTCVRQLF